MVGSGRRLGLDELSILHRQLGELVAARAPLPRGLAALAADLAPGGRLLAVVESLRAEVEGGATLADALERQGHAVPSAYRALVAAGERAGDLSACLLAVAEQAEQEAELQRRLREALAYP